MSANVQTLTKEPENFPKYLKVCLLTVAVSFLAYSIYWAAITPFSTYGVLTFIETPAFQNSAMNTPLEVQLVLFQEVSAAIGYITNLIAAVLALKSIIHYIKNDQKLQSTLGWTLIVEAVFFLLFIPTTLHHMGGAIISMEGAVFFVGLSYLLQALLIVPPFMILGSKLRNKQSQAAIKKWACIAAPLFVLAFWCKYLFLWIDTLSPMGPQQATIASTVGVVNSWITLLFAGVLTTFACSSYYKTEKMNKWLVGIALIVFGGHFIFYDLVSIWVLVYIWFFYVTDIWMITLSILGIAILKLKINT
jgi:hypothetical protein